MYSVIGYPCALLVWDKMGYHDCAGLPIKDEKGKWRFACCSCVWVLGFGDLSDFNETDAEHQCPKKYSWNIMKSKVEPSIELALKQRGES